MLTRSGVCVCVCVCVCVAGEVVVREGNCRSLKKTKKNNIALGYYNKSFRSKCFREDYYGSQYSPSTFTI